MRKRLFMLVLTLLTVSVSAQKVRVAAASNLRFVLEAIKVEFEKENPTASVELVYGASGSLSQQIMNGAGFDLFMAADEEFPNKLKAKGFVAGDVKIYAYGTLVLWSNSVDVSKGLAVLNDKSVRRIALAKPELAPYGAGAVECLKYYQLFDRLKSKLVYADNISQTAQFVQTGNAELGFLAYSLTMASTMKGTIFKLDPKSYHPIRQAMVRINKTVNPLTEKLMDFILSSDCKPIFKKFGYGIPE